MSKIEQNYSKVKVLIFKKEFAIHVSVSCIFGNNCEQKSYQCSKQAISAVHLATGFSDIPMCAWLGPAPSPATIPGNCKCHQNGCGEVVLENGKKHFGKTWTENSPWRTSPCSLLKQIQWSQHDSYGSTGLTVHHGEPKDYTVPWILPFFVLECLFASPEHPIMQALITHYVKFVWEIFWFASYLAILTLENLCLNCSSCLIFLHFEQGVCYHC